MEMAHPMCPTEYSKKPTAEIAPPITNFWPKPTLMDVRKVHGASQSSEVHLVGAHPMCPVKDSENRLQQMPNRLPTFGKSPPSWMRASVLKYNWMSPTPLYPSNVSAMTIFGLRHPHV